MEKTTSDKERRREVWRKVLGWKCHTPDSYLDEIDTKYTNEKEKTNVLADVYINSRPDSSWEHVLKTLYYSGQLVAAKEAKSFLQQNGECCCGVVQVSLIMCAPYLLYCGDSQLCMSRGNMNTESIASQIL